MARRFMSINLAKPMATVGQNPFVLCAWPSFAAQPYITHYRVYDDRVGETTRFTYRPGHEWYWVPQQQPSEVSLLKCYDSVTDGSVSRWSCFLCERLVRRGGKASEGEARQGARESLVERKPRP